MVDGDKTGILVNCSFHHNTSSVRSKNWWDGRRNTTVSEGLSIIATHNEKYIYSKLHLSLSDRIIIGGYAFSFQPKSPLLADETMCRARAIGIQHANMSLESGRRHFTWFLDVLHAFLSVSELLWTLFSY